MACAPTTSWKRAKQIIELAEFTKGYDGGTYTLSDVPAGVTASLEGSRMTVSLAESFDGIGYVTFTLRDGEGDSFTRKIGVTQGLPLDSEKSEISDDEIPMPISHAPIRDFVFSFQDNVASFSGLRKERPSR